MNPFRSGCEVSPRTVAHVLAHLPAVIRSERLRRRLTITQAAREIGVGISTMYDLERGRPFMSHTLHRVLCWLDEGSEYVMTGANDRSIRAANEQ